LFFYGNMLAAGLADTGEPFAGTYAAAFEGSRIVAVAGHFWNNTMLLQAPFHLQLLIRMAQRSCGRPLKRLVGPDEQVAMAIDYLGLTASALQMDEPEKLYSLDLSNLTLPVLLARKRARSRLIEPEDEDLVTAWRAGYYRELHLAEDSDELHDTARKAVQREIALRRTWLLEVGGKPVSCTSFNATVRDEGIASIVQVGGVYTPPEERGQGYARAVVAASLLDARAEGFERSVLFTGISNMPAQKAYEALGYRVIGSYRITVLNQAL
jgi:ribosomal protein S18 acetylase RimI-like enzyme